MRDDVCKPKRNALFVGINQELIKVLPGSTFYTGDVRSLGPSPLYFEHGCLKGDSRGRPWATQLSRKSMASTTPTATLSSCHLDHQEKAWRSTSQVVEDD